jgi:P-type E1-E2 ATPase
MLEMLIPGWGTLNLEHLVLDLNGTLCVDGILVEGVRARLEKLRSRLELHLISANTHGQMREIAEELRMEAVLVTAGGEAEQKEAFVYKLGASCVAAIGQGANDAHMLSAARLGIAILSPEGLAVPSLLSADLVAPDILSALDLLQNTQRLVASLRS